MSGSSGLTLLDDDHLTPAQECVVLIKKKVEVFADVGDEIDDGKDYVKLGNGKLAQINEDGSLGKQLTKAEISIADCLACSGCITSAETILVSKQSLLLFLEKAKISKEEKNLHIFTILSPQAVVGIAKRYNLTKSMAFWSLSKYLKQIGVEVVLDPTIARNFVIRELYDEFMGKLSKGDANTRNQPLLVSTCPGWVCYAEKLHDTILPSMSKVKSPQQVMARFIRDVLCAEMYGEEYRNRATQQEKVLITAIMPCYDKKLEASREDFILESFEDGSLQREVDIVLTTKELIEHIEEDDESLWKSIIESVQHPDFAPFTTSDPKEEIINGILKSSFVGDDYATPEGEGSGGFIEAIFRRIARDNSIPIGDSVEFKRVTNSDFVETELDTKSDLGTLRFAKTYGFRNLQNVLRRAKANRLKYDLIDVQACPTACINGGGMPTLTTKVTSGIAERPREYLDTMVTMMKDDPNLEVWEDPTTVKYWSKWLDDAKTREDVLWTQYHSRKDVDTVKTGNLSISW